MKSTTEKNLRRCPSISSNSSSSSSDSDSEMNSNNYNYPHTRIRRCKIDHSSNISSSTLKRVRIANSTLINVRNAKWTKLTVSTIANVQTMKRCDVQYAHIHNVDYLRKATVERSNVMNCVMIKRSTVRDSLVTHTVLGRSSLDNCQVTDCVMYGSKFEGMKLENGIWKNGKLIGRVDETREVVVRAIDKTANKPGSTEIGISKDENPAPMKADEAEDSAGGFNEPPPRYESRWLMR